MGILNLRASRKLLLFAASMAFAASAFCAPSLAFADDAADDLAAGAGIEQDGLVVVDDTAAEAAALPSDAGASAADAVESAMGDADAVIVEDAAAGQVESDVSGADDGAVGENAGAGEDVDGAADVVDGAIAEDASVSDAEDVAGEAADDASAAQDDEGQFAVPVVKDFVPVKENATAGFANNQAAKAETAAKPAASKSGAKGAGDVVLKPQEYTVVEIPKTVNRVYQSFSDEELPVWYCPFGCADDEPWSEEEEEKERCSHRRACDDYDSDRGWYILSGGDWAYCAGSYKVTVRLESGFMWSDGTTGDKVLTWEIYPMKVSAPKVYNRTYDGMWQCPFLDEGICDSDSVQFCVEAWGYVYEMTPCHKRLPGTYSFTVRPGTNYVWSDGTTGSKVVTWKILPIVKLAKPTKTSLKFNTSLTFNGYTRRVNGKAVDSRMTATGLKACAPGTYTATFKPKAGYLWSDGTSSAVKLTWRIAKARASSLKALFSDGNGGATRAYARVKGRTGGEYVQLNLSMGSGKAFCAVAGKTVHDKGGYDGSIVRSVRYRGNGLPGTATITIRLNKAFFAGDDPLIKKTFTILPANANGWVKSGGKWYYTGKCINSGGKRSTVTPGKAPGGTGWKYIGGSWYFFSRNTYAMVTGLFRDGGKTYYCDSSGAMLGGCWKKVGGYWYYFGGSGAAYTGRHKIGGVWYKFDSRGRMV